jgi:DNA-directed RNA polymerase subunit M/transcription elongation factor TFIIS
MNGRSKILKAQAVQGLFARGLAQVRSRYIIPTTMEIVDPTAEWRRLSEHYRRMSDNELLVLARQNSELTEAAQRALADEVCQRGLKLQPEKLSVPPNPEPQPDSPYAEDRELIEICTVWSFPDALQLQMLLDRVGIPFFMGPEKARGVDAVTSNFVNGVSVRVMRIGLPWTHQALQNYTPANEPGPKQEIELCELPVRCPKCHSTEVIFDRLLTDPAAATGKSPTQYEWTCDSCGNQWKDDGTAREE